MPSSPALRRVLRAAAVAVPLGVVGNVALALLTTDQHVLAATAGLPLAPLVVAGGLALVPWVTATLRVQLWTSFLGHPVRFAPALRAVLGGMVGSVVTPTGSGGGALKWALLSRRGLPAGAAGTLLVVEAAENAVFMAVALPVALTAAVAAEAPALRTALAGAGMGLAPVLLGLAGAALGAGALTLAGSRGALGRGPRRLAARVRRRLRRPVADARHAAALVARRGRARFAVGLALAAVQWAARYSVAAALLAFLGAPVRPVLSWALQWATFTLMSVVPTPGAAGGAEAAFAALYAPFVPADVLGLATAAWRLVLFYGPLTVAALVFLGLGRISTPSDGATDAASGAAPAVR